ncbi:MAG: phosphoenolpyruvate--protein phosphotransferase [Anaerolineae bacterium]|nr:phosphoenolpyruvate--protein phosphotransferase [Anaerolineae bacterium]
MKQLDLIIQNPTGLHARPAAVFVNTAKQFQANIRVQHGAKKANAKSVISVLTLGVERGGQICITAEGPDEDEALAVLKTAVENGLGDELPGANGHSTGPTEIKPAPVEQPAAPSRVSDSIRRGIPAAAGIAVGPVYQFQPVKLTIVETIATPEEERARLDAGLDSAKTELQTLYQQVLQRLGAGEAAIFEAHLAILADPDLRENALSYILAGQSATQSWQQAVEEMAAALAQLQDELLAARAADIRDVGQRVLRAVAGLNHSGPELPAEPVILIAHDLSPSDTVSLDPNRVLGFCTAVGGANGHTAILARALGLPALVGAGPDILTVPNGAPAILDGAAGTLSLSPDPETVAQAQHQRQTDQTRRAAELEAAAEPALTQDNHQVEVVANIGSLADARQAVSCGAEGVGLLRTEFLFLDRPTPPTETEQFEVYRDIVLALAGRPVIIRTLDVGGDKPLAYLPLPPEENPFLGQRGVRLSLARPDLLRVQLRAIFRAAAFGPCRIMFPMITTLEDWRAVRQMVAEVQAELVGPAVELGIMVEVPAAALIADSFAREVDFFSIGTNDLTQYTLAMDRGHPALSAQADGLHPAVLRLIAQTVKAAHAAGKWVGVCGELAANPQAIPLLVGLGVDELSASVPAIPAVKTQIRTLAWSKTQELATQALACATAAEVRAVGA